MIGFGLDLSGYRTIYGKYSNCSNRIRVT